MKKLLILSFILLLTVGCHRDARPDETLVWAERLMAEHPDSSYRLLKDYSIGRLSKSGQMQYALLLAEATDRSLLPLLPCDSLLTEAIKYYKRGPLYAKAKLYKGRVYSLLKMEKEAMKCCFDALQELHEAGEEWLKLKGMVYADLGNLYQGQFQPEDALNAYLEALHCMKLCNNKQGISSINSSIGFNVLLNNDTTESRTYMKEAIYSPCNQIDSATVANAFYALSLTYEEEDSVLKYAKSAYELSEKHAGKAAIMLGYAYMNKAVWDSSAYYLNYAIKDKSLDTRAVAYAGLRDLMDLQEDYKQALVYSEIYGRLMDSVYLYKKSTEFERESYKYRAELEVHKDKIALRNRTYIICIVVLLFVILTISYVVYSRRARQLRYERDEEALKSEIAELEYHIASLRNQHEENMEKMTEKEFELQCSVIEKAKIRNSMFMQTEIYKKIEQLSHQKKEIAQNDVQVLLNEEQDELRKVVNEIYADYIQHLKQLYPKYTNDDCMLACLSLLNWDDFTLALCFGNFSTRAIVQRRYRMRKKEEKGDKE